MTADADALALALRTQLDRIISGETVTGLEQINLLYEAAEFVEATIEVECEGGHDTSAILWPGTEHQGVVCRRCKRFLPC